MEVVAEGVETAAQVAQLKALGCGFGQGHWFARPADPAAIELLLQKGVYQTHGNAPRSPLETYQPDWGVVEDLIPLELVC